jgi:putative CRISPR-associated protein (TIGR02619 family)
MRELRYNVISTVGISLLSNVQREQQRESVLEQLAREQRWRKLGEYLAKRDPADRILGAELNSLAQLTKRKDVRPSSIWFMMSDTGDAKTTEEILKGYFSCASWPGIKPSDIHFVYVEDLQDTDPGRFRTRGLRNLVRAMAQVIRERGPNSIAIDATGGYKAQVALAVALGQAMNIPVYYRHDRFAYIIELPPMPITFDYDVLGRNAWLLQRLENNGTATSSEIEPVEDKIKVLLQDIEIDGHVLWELSPVGLIYLAGYRQMVYPTVTLQEPKSRKPPEMPNHHLPNGFFPFTQKVWTENGWISRLVYLESGEKKGTQAIRFFTKESEQGLVLMGDYFSNFCARFRIHISSEEPHELAWAAMTLNDKYVR